MGYKITVAPSARRDLRDIVRYISLDSKERAVEFGRFLIESTRRLSDFPEMGRVVPEFKDPSVREIVVRSSYRVVYRVKHADQRVEVVRFWHAARGTPEVG
jgi:addiction module RelE/StbE family toxin